MTNVNRKLSTILAADCAGFSKFMDKNEELTLDTLKRCRSIIDPIIAKYSGRIFYTAGDSVIAEFQSPLNAVNAAIDFQSNIHDENNSIQNGIRDMLVAKSCSPASTYIPIAAGTIVVGRVPRTPPTIPPHLSIAMVTNIATNPANSADRIIVCIA